MQAIKEEEQLEEGWDFKKIAIGITVLLISCGALYYYFFLNSGSQTQKAAQILGEKFQDSTGQGNNSTPPAAPSKEEMEKMVTEVKENVLKITPDNVTSSSGDLQKIIDDLKALQNQSKKPVDVICDVVCKK